MADPEYVIAFTKVVYPETFELELTVGSEESLLVGATSLIAELKAEVERLEADNTAIGEDQEAMAKQLAEAESHADDLNVLVLEQADKITLLRAVADAAERWSKNLPGWMLEDIGPFVDPTFYGTLSHEGDLKVIEQTKKDLAAIKAAKDGGAL
jgi:hypothetical protein